MVGMNDWQAAPLVSICIFRWILILVYIWNPPNLATQISIFLCGSGILLFREASTILVTYGTRILQRTQSGRPKRDDCSDPLPSSAIGSKISGEDQWSWISWKFLSWNLSGLRFPQGFIHPQFKLGWKILCLPMWIPDRVKLWGPRFRDVYVEKYKGIGVCGGTKVWCAKFVAFDWCFLKFFLIQYQPQKTWLECWSSQKIQLINHDNFCHLFSPDAQSWGLDMFSHALHGLLGQKGPVNVGDWPSLEHLVWLLGIQFSRAHGPMKHRFLIQELQPPFSASWRAALDRLLRNYTNFGVFELYSVSSSRKCHFICFQPLLQETWWWLIKAQIHFAVHIELDSLWTGLSI